MRLAYEAQQTVCQLLFTR